MAQEQKLLSGISYRATMCGKLENQSDGNHTLDDNREFRFGCAGLQRKLHKQLRAKWIGLEAQTKDGKYPSRKPEITISEICPSNHANGCGCTVTRVTASML